MALPKVMRVFVCWFRANKLGFLSRYVVSCQQLTQLQPFCGGEWWPDFFGRCPAITPVALFPTRTLKHASGLRLAYRF